MRHFLAPLFLGWSMGQFMLFGWVVGTGEVGALLLHSPDGGTALLMLSLTLGMLMAIASTATAASLSEPG